MDNTDALTRYLFNHRRDLFTEDENQASYVALWQEKAQAASDAMAAMLWRKVEQARTQATDRLLQDGSRVFRARVRDRILAQYGDAILNRCPRCSGLCRTPRARQCPHCFHDWH